MWYVGFRYNFHEENPLAEVTIITLCHSGADKGSTKVQFTEFDGLDAALDWARDVNERHEQFTSHVTNLSMENGDFAALDISAIWDAHKMDARDLPHVRFRWVDSATISLAKARHMLAKAQAAADAALEAAKKAVQEAAAGVETYEEGEALLKMVTAEFEYDVVALMPVMALGKTSAPSA
jgi:hypothetical protein